MKVNPYSSVLKLTVNKSFIDLNIQ